MACEVGDIVLITQYNGKSIEADAYGVVTRILPMESQALPDYIGVVLVGRLARYVRADPDPEFYLDNMIGSGDAYVQVEPDKVPEHVLVALAVWRLTGVDNQ